AYTAARPWPVILALHGQTGRAAAMGGFWGATAARYGFILLSPEYVYGRADGYNGTEDEHRAVLGALRDASRTLNLDWDRVFLIGHSQGGHAAWEIGSAHAGTFAGVVPLIGVLPFRPLHFNYRNTPAYVIDGSDDGTAPSYNRASIAELAALGCDATYVEYPGRGHEAFSEEYPAVAEWMLQRHRDPGPARVVLRAARPGDLECRWIRITETPPSPPSDAAVKADELPQVVAAWRGDTIEMRADNVLALQVGLPPELAKYDRPLTIVCNGRTQKATPRLDWAYALRRALATGDRQDLHLGVVDVRP
ncbi:MAG: hypothetical protein KJ579_11210, partial [Verrucomicrobia bacterium]|nr:hypothetical protein [Verrucomicrobiota bacterium]